MIRKRFWQFVHDRLEQAWHWVYYHKLAEPLPPIVQTNVKYKFTYTCGKAATMIDLDDKGKK